MEITLQQLGTFIGIFMLVIGTVCYVIGQKKTASPVKAALIGGLFSMVPILGLIYVAYLVTQDDLEAQ